MSLDWNIEHVEDYQKLFTTEDSEHKQLNSTTEFLILATMNIGIGEINKRNWKDFYLRLRISGAHKAVMKRDEDGEFTIPISPEDIYRHIGLHTNASKLSRTQFLQQCYRGFEWRHQEKLKGIEKVKKKS